MILTCLMKKTHNRDEHFNYLKANPDLKFDEESYKIWKEKDDKKKCTYLNCKICGVEFELERVYKKYFEKGFTCKYCKTKDKL